MTLMQLLPGFLAGALLLGACAAPATVEPAPAAAQAAPVAAAEEAVAEEPTAEPATVAPSAVTTGTGEVMEVPAAEVPATEVAEVERPAWQQIELTNARTGETFTLGGFGDKMVYVEPFATWCTNCRKQLGNVQAARAQAGDDVVFVILSVEPNIAAEALAGYADKAGFEAIFAAMPPAMLQELAAQYGQTVSNPPATPHFIIRRDGSTTELVTGIDDVDTLLAQIEAARG